MSGAGSRYRDIKKVACLLRSEADRRILSLGLVTILVVVGSGALAALSPMVLKTLVDLIAESQHTGITGIWPPILHCGIEYLILLLTARALADIRPLLSGAINQRLHRRITLRFFDHVLRLPMRNLLTRRSGELQHNLDLASTGAQLAVSHLAGSLLPVLIEFSTMVGVLIHLGQSTVIAVFGATALVYFAIFSTGARLMTGAAHEVSKSSLEMYAQLGDALAHFETLRYFTAEKQARQRLRGANGILEKRWMKLHHLNFSIALAASGTFSISMATCLLIGADAVARNTMSIGGFVLTTVYMTQMVRPLELLGNAAKDLSRAVSYLRPLLELLSEPLSAETTGMAPNTTAHGTGQRQAPTVRLENLHFGYDPGRPVLKGIDLYVPAGTTTAIVGASGSGKSSLARLLMRLYTPQKGRILIDGCAIDLINTSELRSTLISIVPQETALLHESIADNISLGTPSATRNDIRMAARDAQLEDLVANLPDGLDTPVGERGMQLSGGERQRVGIARALLRRPRLYILDEPTSMLDSKTEFQIQKALQSLSTGATKIIIAHRLSTVVHADEIVVLDDGQIRERGSHHALLTKNGLYARMWRQQMLGAA